MVAKVDERGGEIFAQRISRRRRGRLDGLGNAVAQLDTGDIDRVCINTIRTLSMDAIQQANSGHPGTPMALAPLAHVLYSRVMKFNPADPTWADRDRFVLSNGHASILQYSMLYLCGFGLELDAVTERFLRIPAIARVDGHRDEIRERIGPRYETLGQ